MFTRKQVVAFSIFFSVAAAWTTAAWEVQQYLIYQARSAQTVDDLAFRFLRLPAVYYWAEGLWWFGIFLWGLTSTWFLIFGYALVVVPQRRKA